MANVNKNGVSKLRQFGGTPYGNAWVDRFVFETNATGVFVDSDQATAVANGDVVRIGMLPAGLEIHDSLAIVSTIFTAATTAAVGFLYADGVDSVDVPQNAAYFNTALATSALGRTRANNNAVKPEILPKDAYLTLTVGGASHAKVGRLDLIIQGIWTGLPSV